MLRTRSPMESSPSGFWTPLSSSAVLSGVKQPCTWELIEESVRRKGCGKNFCFEVKALKLVDSKIKGG